MKKLFFLSFVFLFNAVFINAQTDKKDYTILLTGASFASPGNGWFELGVEHLNAKGINRAIGGESIASAANRMFKGELYSPEEFEEIDALVIMQVHDRNVADTTQLKDDYEDYQLPFEYATYAPAYDYVIKRYITECYNLKHNDKSRYYNTPTGKPVIIVLCTHWHDSRVIYNPAIRTLATRWGFPLVEFDKYIGFSKNQLHPVTKDQMSKLYTKGNITKEHGVEYGWHPEGGKDKYIQQRMASIFVDTMKKILPLK